jgi:uncharacterized protein YutE (UPF0331/DUF86 family)
MDTVVIERKLESLRRCIARLESKRPASVPTLTQDPDLQDILVLNLTRAVQLCVDIGSHLITESEQTVPGTMGEVFSLMANQGIIDENTATAMRKAVGFRNIAIHNYRAVDWAIVHAICHHQLDDFKAFARRIIDHCEL